MVILKYNKYIKRITLLLIIMTTGCSNSDNFYETQRIILTDKKEYKIGDNIELTFKISTKKDKKSIRLYENYKNIEIFFSTFNNKSGNQNISLDSGKNLKKAKTFEKIITKKNPLILTFKGNIQEFDNNIILSFPELNFVTSFKKIDVLKNDTFIRIHALCNPINPEFGASLEEYFEVKDIKIKL